MSMSTLVQSKVVSREEWLAAGEALLAKEKVMTPETMLFVANAVACPALSRDALCLRRTAR
jgi:predicted dithiol-disulfide oxidoreductase (DUF899 family)